MKLSFVSLLIFFLGFLLFSCKSENKTKDEIDYYQFQNLNLHKYDLAASINIPNATAGIGATFVPEVIHQIGGYKWKIAVGKNFELFIEDYGDYPYLFPEYKKKLFSNNKYYKIKILKKEKNLLLFKRTIRKNLGNVNSSSYHLFSVINMNGINYQLTNRESGDSKKVIDFIYKSVKSFKKIKIKK